MTPVLLVVDRLLADEVAAVLFGPRGRNDGTDLDIATSIPADLTMVSLVATVGRPGDPMQRAVARIASAASKPNTSLRLTEDGFELGPMNLPGRSACLECYLQRRRPDIPLEDDRLQTTNELDLMREQRALPPEVLRFGIAALGIQLAARPVKAGHAQLAQVYRCYIPHFRWRQHQVYAVPGCSMCRVGAASVSHGDWQ